MARKEETNNAVDVADNDGLHSLGGDEAAATTVDAGEATGAALTPVEVDAEETKTPIAPAVIVPVDDDSADETVKASKGERTALTSGVVAQGCCVTLSETEHYQAGEKLRLPAAEFKRLRDLGFVVLPRDAVVGAVVDGVTLTTDGPAIRQL